MVDAATAERLRPLEKLKGLESTHLLINEIYASIQGESTHAGRACVFVRTSVCNQRCSYCDTAYAFHGGERRSIASIAAAWAASRVSSSAVSAASSGP